MKLVNYSLKVGEKTLFSNVNINFHIGKMNHILGSNGVGKSCFAKSLIGIFPYSGTVIGADGISLIGSYSGIPTDLSIKDLYPFLKAECETSTVDTLYHLLSLESVNNKQQIKSMSDGQKQKIKLWCFLSRNPNLIVLDEFTTALDKKSVLEIYDFISTYLSKEKATIFNITHNLSDVDSLGGYYFYIDNHTITEIESKDELFNLYIKQGG